MPEAAMCPPDLAPAVENADDAGRNPDGHAARRNVFGDHRAGARDRSPTDPDRRDEHRVAPDVGAVPDGGAVLFAVEPVVAGNRAGADVDVGPDPGVP